MNLDPYNDPVSPGSFGSKAMANSFYERLIDRQSSVLALECEDGLDQVIAELRVLSQKRGVSIYHWQPGQGLISLKASEISVPGSRPLVDALRYVSESMHFGIYAFTDFQSSLNVTCLEHLRTVASGGCADERKIILIGRSIELPARLMEQIDLVSNMNEAPTGLRLRDGRWTLK